MLYMKYMVLFAVLPLLIALCGGNNQVIAKPFPDKTKNETKWGKPTNTLSSS